MCICVQEKNNDRNYRRNFFFINYFLIVVRCSSLEPPNDGYVKPSSCTGSPVYGTTCHFSCPKGYRLQGEPVASCLSDGQWSKSTSAFCKGQFIVLPSSVSENSRMRTDLLATVSISMSPSLPRLFVISLSGT